jgi:hypothetical protein
MQSIIKLPSAAASQITVSTTAMTINDFIEAAAGSDFKVPTDANSLDIQVESNSIRFLTDGNTPTSSLGFEMSASGISIKQFRGFDLTKFYLIRSGGADAVCNVSIGKIIR